jgi:uncharacterized protein (DUF2147 family)
LLSSVPVGAFANGVMLMLAKHLGRIALFGFLAPCFLANTARAAEPWGEWLVKDKTAQIRIADCASALWGVISWEADQGVDAKNPDLGKRSRPTLGLPILLGLKASGPNRWEGALYNAENGKTYSGGVTVVSAEVLRVRGCVLGFLCGGEDWTRGYPSRPGAIPESDSALCARLGQSR